MTRHRPWNWLLAGAFLLLLAITGFFLPQAPKGSTPSGYYTLRALMTSRQDLTPGLSVVLRDQSAGHILSVTLLPEGCTLTLAIRNGTVIPEDSRLTVTASAEEKPVLHILPGRASQTLKANDPTILREEEAAPVVPTLPPIEEKSKEAEAVLDRASRMINEVKSGEKQP